MFQKNALKVLHIIDHMGDGGAQEMLRILQKKVPTQIIFLRECQKLEIFKKFSPVSFFSVYKKLKKIQPEIIHIHLQKSLWCVIFGRIFFPEIFVNKKLIFHEHGTVLEKNFWYGSLIKISQKHIDKYISPSKSTKKALIQNTIFSEKIYIIPNLLQKPLISKKKRF